MTILGLQRRTKDLVSVMNYVKARKKAIMYFNGYCNANCITVLVMSTALQFYIIFFIFFVALLYVNYCIAGKCVSNAAFFTFLGTDRNIEQWK